jgi:hypothetical protein
MEDRMTGAFDVYSSRCKNHYKESPEAKAEAKIVPNGKTGTVIFPLMWRKPKQF